MIVSEAIFNIRSEIIRWPDLNIQEETSRSVEQGSKIPSVTGFVGGTHTPDTNYQGLLINKCSDHSGDRLLVTDLHAGWSECTHDARIFRNSSIFEALQRKREKTKKN